MVNERDHILLHPMSVQQIDEIVFKNYNYNGLEAHNDLQKIARADASRKNLRMTVPLWLGMTAVSGYNVSRMGVLSNSGRIGAIGGLAFGAIMTITTIRM